MTARALITGTLYGDPQARTSQAGKSFTTAKIRADGKDGAVLWISVVAFGDLAERLLTMRANNALALSGKLEVSAYTAKDGTPAAGLSVVADELAALWDDEVFEKYPSWEECVRAEIFISPQLAGYFGPNTGGGGGLSVVADELAALWDDEVFEKYPSWSEIKAENFISLNAESYFSGEGDIGGRNYAQCVKYGIGREVIAKMLEGTETKSAIEQALASLPLTARRKRGAFGTGRTPNKKPGIAPGLLNFDVAGNPCKAPATNNPHSPSRSMNDEICR